MVHIIGSSSRPDPVCAGITTEKKLIRTDACTYSALKLLRGSQMFCRSFEYKNFVIVGIVRRLSIAY
jgi:hypothetical protein